MSGEDGAPGSRVPRTLRLWWWSAALLALAAAGALAALLPVPLPGRLLYLGVSGAVLLLFFGVLWRMLGEIRVAGRDETSPLPGIANTVTVARAALTALLAGLLVVPWSARSTAWLAALLYLLVALGDGADGWLARRRRFVTRLGTRLDLEVDAASLLVATLLAAHHGVLPGWVILAGVARYLYVGVRAVARRLGGDGEGCALPPSRTRRLRAGQQMGLVAVALWPPAPAPGVHLAALVVTLPFLAGFVRDTLVVSGALDAASRRYRRARAALLLVVESATPIAARLVLGGALAVVVVDIARPDGGSSAVERWTATFAAWGWPSAASFARLATIAGAAAATAVVAGILPRIAALVLAGVFFVELQSVALDSWRALLLCAVLWVLVFGPGRWTLWAPDEALLGQGRAGAVRQQRRSTPAPARRSDARSG